MPTILPKNIGTLTTFKDTNLQTDIQTLPAPNKPSKRTIEQTIDTQKTDDENLLQQQHQHNAVPSSILPRVQDMSLWEAAERANIGVIQRYLDRETTQQDLTALVNSQDPVTGATLLHLVITHAPSMTGNTPQVMAAAEKDIALRLELVTLLLESGANTATCNLYNVQAIHMVPLHIPTNALPYLVTLLDHDANLDAQDGDGWTPLHYAARFCQPPTLVMQALVSRGANVNATDHTSYKSCLFGLIANGDHVECFQWMIQTAKANVQLRGQFSFSPTITSTTKNGNDGGPMKRTMVTDHSQKQQQQYVYTDIMKQATLVLQAVKYGRLGILRYLIHTPKTLNKLRSFISLEELEQAQYVISQHLAGKKRNHWELVDKEIQYLSCLLEHDPRSLVAKQTRKLITVASSSSLNWTNLGQQEQRRILARKIQQFFMKPKQLIHW